MTDRFDDVARGLFGAAPFAIWASKPVMDIVADALRAQHRAGQEAMRERAKAKCEETADWMLNRGKRSDGAALCADRVAVIPVEEPTP